MYWPSVMCITISLWSGVTADKDEFFTSIYKMSTLLNIEDTMLDNMQTFIRKNEYKLNFLKERLSEYERERQDALNMGRVYFENPVNKYLLTKRLTTDWERIENILQHKEGEKTLRKTEENLIDDSELVGAIAGLLRLQDFYRLNTKDIVRGILQGVQYDTHFDAHHCYDIGKQALETNFVRLGLSWLTEGLNRCQLTDMNEKIKLGLGLAEAKAKLGDIPGANQTYAELASLHPENEQIAQVYSEFAKSAEKSEIFEVDYINEHDPLPEDMFAAEYSDLFKYTCAGLMRKSAAQERSLSCGYLVETHPFLLLAPIKVEELNRNPLLVQFYDVVSDEEIEQMKSVIDHLERATVFGPRGSVVSYTRTSLNQFLKVKKHPVLAKVAQRVEDMTKLNTKYSEDHQFANYGIGGHFAYHYDWFAQSAIDNKMITNSEMGNRMATFMIYLSNVEQGGGTAFPLWQALAVPKKGSAVFWYDLHASGEADYTSVHGGCPIIVGSKWVNNVWLREYDQSDRRPCYTYNDADLYYKS